MNPVHFLLQVRRMRFHWQSISGLVVLLLLSPAATVWSASSTDDPDAALATRPEKDVQQLASDGAEQYRIANDILSEMLAKLDAGQAEKIDLRKVGPCYVAIIRLDRIAQELLHWGETAGYDFKVRADALRIDWRRVRQELLKIPSVNVKINGIYTSVMSGVEKRKKALLRAEQFAKQGDLEQAEDVMTKELDAMEETACWLTDMQHASPAKVFETVDELLKPLEDQRQAAGQKRIAELRDAESPKLFQLTVQLKQAVTDLRAANQAMLDGQACSGPELVKQAGDQWRKLQLAAIHCRGFDWSREMLAGQPASEPLAELTQDQAAFTDEMVKLLGQIIEADAASTEPAEASAKYAAYLEHLAPLVTLYLDDKLRESVQPALQALAARSPELQADVAAYDTATGELLRWKRRLADAQQQQQAAGFPSYEQTALGALAITATQPAGLVRKDSAQLTELALISSLPKSLHRLKQELAGKQVTLAHFTGLAPAKRLTASRHANRHYATLVYPETVLQQIAALEADLLVTSSSPALTLSAAAAVASAKRGDLQAAGVTLQRIFAEPLATRTATLPEIASPLFPLGLLEAEVTNQTPLSQLTLRSDVQPHWLRHEYFFLTVSP